MGQTTYEEELAAKKELVESYIGKYCKNIHDVAGMYYPFIIVIKSMQCLED